MSAVFLDIVKAFDIVWILGFIYKLPVAETVQHGSERCRLFTDLAD